MSTVTSSWRQRRQAARTRRAIDRALARTSSPAMRDELLTMANSSPALPLSRRRPERRGRCHDPDLPRGGRGRLLSGPSSPGAQAVAHPNGSVRLRFEGIRAVQEHVHHEGTSTASGPSAARRTPGRASAYPLTGVPAMTAVPRRGARDLRRDHRWPAALRPHGRRRRRRRPGAGAGRRAVHRRAARGPGPLVELRHPDPAVRGRDRGRRRPPADVPGRRRRPADRAGALDRDPAARHGHPAPGLPPAAPRRREVQHDVDDGDRRVRRHVGHHPVHPAPRLRALPAGLHLRAGPAHAPCPRSSACPRRRSSTTSASPTAPRPASTA